MTDKKLYEMVLQAVKKSPQLSHVPLYSDYEPFIPALIIGTAASINCALDYARYLGEVSYHPSGVKRKDRFVRVNHKQWKSTDDGQKHSIRSMLLYFQSIIRITMEEENVLKWLPDLEAAIESIKGQFAGEIEEAEGRQSRRFLSLTNSAANAKAKRQEQKAWKQSEAEIQKRYQNETQLNESTGYTWARTSYSNPKMAQHLLWKVDGDKAVAETVIEKLMTLLPEPKDSADQLTAKDWRLMHDPIISIDKLQPIYLKRLYKKATGRPLTSNVSWDEVSNIVEKEMVKQSGQAHVGILKGNGKLWTITWTKEHGVGLQDD